MKATILLEELNCDNCMAYICQKLSLVKDVYDILPDAINSKITFTYKSENAALEAVEILSDFRKHEKDEAFNENLKIA